MDDTDRLLDQWQPVDGATEVWLVCVRCNVSCAHDVLAELRNRWSVAEGAGRMVNTFQLVQCGGCKSVGYRQEHALTTIDEVILSTDEERYPKRDNARGPFRGIQDLPPLTCKIYLETLRAINENSPILAGVGIRAIVEGVCKDKRAHGQDLKMRIEALGAAGLLGALDVKRLHKLRFLGNKAAHETDAPTAADLTAALDIAEHLLETVYVLPKIGDRLPAPP